MPAVVFSLGVLDSRLGKLWADRGREQGVRLGMLLLFVVGMLPGRAVAQLDDLQDIETVLDTYDIRKAENVARFRNINPHIQAACPGGALTSFQTIMQSLEATLAAERKLKANASFTLNDNVSQGKSLEDPDADTRQQHAVNASIDFHKGNYPTEVALRGSW